MNFPTLKYKTIVADPPWSYTNKKTGGSMVFGATSKYPTMSLQELIELPVWDITANNCVLFLWVTTPLKYDIAQSGLLESWGFTYKTTIYWRKIMSLGMGFWYRGQVEECWLCTKGNVKAFRQQVPNIIQSKVHEHSRKPDELFSIIQPAIEKFDLTPKIELFARERREGWDCWGNDIPVQLID